MEKSQLISKLDELQNFKNELVQYSNSVISYLEDGLTEEEKKRGSEIYNTISKKVGYLGSFISELSGIANVDVNGKEYDMWLIALKMPADKLADSALGVCLLATNQAIGKLEDDIKKGKRDEQGNLLTEEKTPSETVATELESPIDLFDRMQLHPRVIQVSESLFKTGNYASAILEAFKAVNNFVKEKSALSPNELRGMKDRPLMAKVFDEKEPLIKLNELITDTDINEQEGFKLLFMGATEGIRNPKAHDLIEMKDPHKTLEYLAFASLLIRRVEEGKVVKPKPPRERWNLEKFLIDAEKRCMPEKIEIMKKLIDFTASNSDAGILWGTGAKYGSFVFQKLVNNKATSIFQIYTDGTFFLYFQPLKNKGVSIALLNQFRLNVNRIPGVNITENVVNEKDKYGSLSLNIFINPSNLNIFKEAVLSLCKDLENYKETSS